MKTYEHDYTNAKKAARELCEAMELHTEAYKIEEEAYSKLNMAKIHFENYFSSLNLIPKERSFDSLTLIPKECLFSKEQLCFIRDEFACIMEKTDNANGELDIINVCQRLLDDPEFESYEQWKRNTSGTWSEIHEEEPEE